MAVASTSLESQLSGPKSPATQLFDPNHFSSFRRSCFNLDNNPTHSLFQTIDSHLSLSSSRNDCRGIATMAGSSKFISFQQLSLIKVAIILLLVIVEEGWFYLREPIQRISHQDLEKLDCSISRRPEFRYKTEFQSHEPEFAYLKSLEIEEKINKIKWYRTANGALFLLSTSDKTIKFWKANKPHHRLTNTIKEVQNNYNDLGIGGSHSYRFLDTGFEC